jgi:hypothetical protein
MLKKIWKLGLFCLIPQRAGSCSFATIPNALKQCTVFANDHSLRSLAGFWHNLI